MKKEKDHNKYLEEERERTILKRGQHEAEDRGKAKDVSALCANHIKFVDISLLY